MRFSFLLLCTFLYTGWFLSLQAALLPAETNRNKFKADSCAKALNYDCAIDLYNQALSFEEGDSSLNDFLSIHNEIGDIYYKQGYFSKANQSYQLVVKYAEAHRMIKERAKALMGQSHILWRYGDNVVSINNILESIDLFKSINDTVHIVSASNILGGIYLSTGEIDKANVIYEETLAIAIASRDSVGMASSYEYKGVVKFFENNYEKAIPYYLKSLAINNKIGNEVDAGITYGNIGEAYLRLMDYENALDYFSTAEEIMIKHNFNSGLIFVNYSAGESLMRLGQFDEAHARFEKSLELIAITGENREAPTVLGLVAECYASEGKFDKAYKVHQQYAVAKDSLNETNQNDRMMQIMSKYEFEKKEQENLFLQKENKIKEKELGSQQSIIRLQYIIGGILTTFLIVVLYLFIKLYRNKVLLDRSNRAKNKLFGFIAHDVKSPLGNLQMLIHMLEEDFEDDKKTQSKLLYEVSKCAYAVVQLTDDLIAWSMAQQDGLGFHPENVILGEIAKDSLELFQSQINYKKITIKNKIKPYVEAHVDKKALLSMIRNVLSNAIKFSHTGGTITLNASELSDKKTGKDLVELRFKDEGIGMTAEKTSHLMTSNEIEATRGTANEKGTGLGLNLVKEFVQKSKGHIKIKSSPGAGTKFCILLPAAKP